MNHPHDAVVAPDRAVLDDVRWDESGVFRVTRAIAIVFAITAPIMAMSLTELPIVARLWTAFLAANLVVWLGVVGVLALRVARRRGSELRGEIRRARAATANRLAID